MSTDTDNPNQPSARGAARPEPNIFQAARELAAGRLRPRKAVVLPEMVHLALEGRKMSENEHKRRWWKEQVAQGGQFVQILTITPSGVAFLHEERKALFSSRILDGLLRLMDGDESQERLGNGGNFE